VNAARIRALIEGKLAERLSSSSLRPCDLLLSSPFGDLTERGLAAACPAAPAGLRTGEVLALR
jgi:hypothetical protein